MLRGFPQVFAVAPSVTLGLGSLPPERLKYASGLFNMMRNLGGAVGIAACSAILNDRTNYHFLVLASHLTSANDALRKFLAVATRHLTGALGSQAAGHLAALKALWHLTYREAATMADADAFLAIGICFAFATILVPLMRRVTDKAAASASGH